MYRMMRSSITTLAAIAAVGGGVAVPAWAGEDPGMCQTDKSRVTIPDSLPVKACFDGKTLHLLNDTEIPVAVTLEGDDTDMPQRSPQGDIGASQMLAFIRPGEFSAAPQINGADFRTGVVPPGYYLKTGVGNSQVKVRISEADAQTQRMYFVAEATWRYAPLKGNAESAKTIATFVSEIAKVGDEYIRCLDRNNAWGDVHCVFLADRNIVFAVGRAAFNGLTKDLPKAVMSLFDTAKWRSAVNDDRQSLIGGTRDFTINAYEPPAAPPTTQAPAPPPAPPKSEEGGGSTQAPPQPEQPQSKTAAATVQNMHLEGEHGLAEDSTPSYLSASMQPSCAAHGCKIDGTDMRSGDIFTAVCWDVGARMTNENRNIRDDDNNENLVDSDRWLKGQKNGHTGWISVVYVTRDSRSLDVARC